MARTPIRRKGRARVLHRVLASAQVVLPLSLAAQAATSAAIVGRVTDETGRGVPRADLVITNRATGASVRSESGPDGRYLLAGLAVGGPYSLTVRRLGARATVRDSIYLRLGEALRLDVRLQPNPVTLQAVETRARATSHFSRVTKGAATLISDSTIQRMPTVNRDLYDLVKLVPQMSTWSALTASGGNPRVNSILLDGVSEQGLLTNLPAGALYGGKSISLEAVKEYQVLLDPFDVRLGNFSGATINAVTRSGTNTLHGSAFVYGTNERLGADVPFVRNTRYQRAQFGLTLSGPIVRDRFHFFLASELQRRVIPASGPYLGQDGGSQTPIPVSARDIDRFQQLLSAKGLDGGSAGAVDNRNPASNVFLRLDATLPSWNSRLTIHGNYTRADTSVFARPTAAPLSNCSTSDCFPLASLRQTWHIEKRSVIGQFHTVLPSGVHNELIVGHVYNVGGVSPTVRQPLVIVTVPGVSGASAVLQSGTHELATGTSSTNVTTQLTENLTIPRGAHRVTLGATLQLLGTRSFQTRGAFGVWQFSSLDSLATEVAAGYRLTHSPGAVRMSGRQYAAYLGDEWDATARLSLAVGMRADVPVLTTQPPYVGAADSALGLRTDRVPSGRVQWSPRVGFHYDATGDEGAPTQLRGGVGLFMGRPPHSWLFGAYSNYGLGTRTLQCGSLAGDAGPPPAFVADYRNPPLACANGRTSGTTTPGEIDVLDPGLRYPQVLRASLALDRTLPLGMEATIEALYTHAVDAMFFSGVNLSEPNALDRHARVLYGAIGQDGVAAPRRRAPQLGNVVSVSNQSRDYAYDVTAELRKAFPGRADVELAVSYGRARDVQSQRIATAILTDNWRYGRPLVGRQESLALGTSDFDQPFRVKASGTLHSPWQRWATELSFYYLGGSGFPYTYVAGGAGGRGDLNADGVVGNDPIYIPRSALDTAEIRFAGSPAEVSAQQAAFDRFIHGSRCLGRQRGHLMTRNSCRSPWINLANLAVRQTMPSAVGRGIVVEVQVFNVLNLLDSHWGRFSVPTFAIPATTTQVPLLTQVGATAGVEAQPIYRFDPSTRRYSWQNGNSYYQIQLALRYRF